VDDWHIRIDRRYLHNEPGAGARAKEQELAAGKGRARRLVERLTDARTDDRSWRRGAEGEERVAAVLDRLDRERWAVIHDLTIGAKGANLDHLVIGPAGVFVLNTKNLTGTLKVYERAIYQNGHKTTFVPSLLREARTVQERLAVASGRPVAAWSLLVLAGACQVEQKSRPTDFTLLRAEHLARWLTALPSGRLSAGDVLRLERAARDPETWFPPRRGRRSTNPAATSGGRERTQPGRQAPTAPRPIPATAASPPPPVPPATEPHQAADEPVGVSVRRWTRYGKDRFYANAADGTRLGYIEVETGEVVLESGDEHGVVSAQLRAARHALGRS
jgi:hypothetical protein